MLRQRAQPPLTSILALASLVSLGCGDSTTSPPESPVVTSVVVTPGAHTFVGRTGTVALSAQVTASDGSTVSGTSVTWTSSDPGVATVSPSGTVSAVAAGRVTITATVEGVSGTAEVTVGRLVTTAGGTVASADGAIQLIIPPGALATDAYITLDEPSNLPGDPDEIPGAAVDIGPSTLALQGDVELLVGYTPLSIPVGESPLSLRAFHLEAGEWVKVAKSLAEIDASRVRSTVAQPGVYGLLIDRLSSDATSMMANFLTARGATGALLPLARHKPRDLDLNDQVLIDALAEELGTDRVAVATVDPAAYDATPPAVNPEDLEIRIFGSADLSPDEGGAEQVADPDPQIAAAVKAILDLMRSLDGFNLPEGQLSDMEFAWRDTEFHEEGDQSGGVMVPADADAISFPLGPDDQFGLFTVDFNVVVVYDGHSHAVFTGEDAQNLRNGDILDTDGTLSGSAKTALHELIHITLKIRLRESKDDDDDLMVAALEAALVAKINLELDRKANGGVASPNRVSAYSSRLETVIERGGADCLHLVGLPGAAGMLIVTIPESVEADGTFTVSVTVQGTDGLPLSGTDVYINQAHFDGDNNPVFGVEDPDRPAPVVVTTDLGGDASLEVQGTSTTGRVNIRVQVGGKTFTGSVNVTPMQKYRIKATAAPPFTTYTLSPGIPVGASFFAWSGANCGSVTGSTTSTMVWDHGGAGCAHAGEAHPDATISLLLTGTFPISGGSFELRCIYTGAASGEGPECTRM